MRPPENLDDLLARLAAMAPDASPDDVRRLGQELAELLDVTDPAELKRVGLPDDVRALLRSMLAVHPDNRPAASDVIRCAQRELEQRAINAATRQNALALLAPTPRDTNVVRLSYAPVDDRVGWFLVVLASVAMLPGLALQSGLLIALAIIGMVAAFTLAHRREWRRRRTLYEHGTMVVGRIGSVEVRDLQIRINYGFEWDGERHDGKFGVSAVNPAEHVEGAEVVVLVDPRNPRMHVALPEFFPDARTMPR